ncbi:MAG: hypothetical protein K0U98_20195 [Deltaproteobacteria bacterium]|nr:hypothetical protein [Deltaproteobacteria bacterium]
MSSKALPVMVLLAAFVALPGQAANFDVVATNSLVFSPANLTIQVGDTVTWTNGGGFHNVEANDGSFRCANGCDGDGGDGAPASNSWSFTLTFDTAGVFDYFCAVHVGVGMTGRITVEAAPVEPGALRFTSGSYQTGEGSGSATITVSRTGGNDGAVSVDFATSNGSATAGQDYTATSGTLNWSDGDDDQKTFSVTILDDSADESQEVLNLSLSNPGGDATLGSPNTATLRISDNDDAPPPPPPGNPGVLSLTQAEISVAETVGSVEVMVSRTAGDDGAVSVSYSTADGSATADADYTPASGTLDWGDGDDAAKSFLVSILDEAIPEGDENLQVSLSDPSGGATLGNLSSSTLTIEGNDQDFGPCEADAQTLCLGENDRFKVQVSFRTQNDVQGSGQAVDFGRRDSGLFYFFNENNIEMLVKILNACSAPAFETYWVFFAATTNVEFNLTVIDTVADQVRQYVNPLGMAALPVQDTDAFATCP